VQVLILLKTELECTCSQTQPEAIYILFRNETKLYFTDLYIILLILIFAKLMLSDTGKGPDLQSLLKISPCSFISFILGECYVQCVNLTFHC